MVLKALPLLGLFLKTGHYKWENMLKMGVIQWEQTGNHKKGVIQWQEVWNGVAAHRPTRHV